MFDPIPDPISGKSILPWAVPVTRALNAIGDKVGASARNERDRRGASGSLPRPFDPVYGTDGVLSSLAWPYYQAGGYTRKLSTNPAIPSESGIAALKYNATQQTDQATIEVYADSEVELPERSDFPDGEEGDEDYKEALDVYYAACLGALQEAQGDQAYVIVPLYLITNSKIVLDMRPIPHVQVAEVVQ